MQPSGTFDVILIEIILDDMEKHKIKLKSKIKTFFFIVKIKLLFIV